MFHVLQLHEVNCINTGWDIPDLQMCHHVQKTGQVYQMKNVVDLQDKFTRLGVNQVKNYANVFFAACRVHIAYCILHNMQCILCCWWLGHGATWSLPMVWFHTNAQFKVNFVQYCCVNISVKVDFHKKKMCESIPCCVLNLWWKMFHLSNRTKAHYCIVSFKRLQTIIQLS